MTNSLITVGKVTGYFGVRGWVKVYSYTDPMENLIHYPEWMIRGRSLKNIKAKKHGKTVVARFNDCDNREDAQPYVGQLIQINADQLEKLPEKEFYWYQLMGLDVIDQNDQLLGKVDDLIETGANDVLVVKGDKEILVPYIQDQVVTQVDLDKGQMSVIWIDAE